MAAFHQQNRLDDDSAILFSSSPQDSSSQASSFYMSPPPSLQFKLTVRNLNYTIHQKFKIPTSFCPQARRNSIPINILKSISFVAKSSEILAIIGPSGAGKSTLLRIISGRIKNSEFDPKSLSISDCPITSPTQLRKICGFVTQEDNLLPLLTVKETLMFSANFRLVGTTAKEKEERVNDLMQELGLVHVADSFIGDEENRGVSGGERKRVSIGVDVIHDPPILLLDEPTSGLDSTSAFHVIDLLSTMAKSRQRTVILTIHQPSYRILQYISSFLLLSRGTVAHAGSLESLEETIFNLGFKIPDQINSIEFSMEVIRLLEESNNKTRTFAEETKKSTYIVQDSALQNSWGDREMGSCYYWRFREILSLCCRCWKIIYRTKQLFLARTMQAVVGGFGLGSVYLKVKADEGGVAERLGLFAFSLSFLLSSTVEALPIFLQERRVLMREASRGAYKVSSYMIANTTVFAPFLLAVALLFAVPVYWLVGLNPSFSAFMFFILVVWMIVLMASSLVMFLSAISSDFIAGNSLICTVLGAFFLFSGYFIPKESIPRYWIFMYYASLYKYPLDSLIINEYWGVRGKCFSWQTLDDNSSKCVLSGGDVLRLRGLEEDSRWMNVGIMVGFFLFYRVLCWIILARKACKTML